MIVEAGHSLVKLNSNWSFAFDINHANKAAKEVALSKLYSFPKEFLAAQTGVNPIAFEHLQKMGADANQPIDLLVKATCGTDNFLNEVLYSDYSRGYFLSPCDGNEVEFQSLDESLKKEILEKFRDTEFKVVNMLFYRQ